MFTGQKPFTGPNVADILRAHQELPIPDPCSVNPDLTAELHEFIQKATQKDPAERYQSMEAVLAHLRPLEDTQQVSRRAEGGVDEERMVLVMSYGNVDPRELRRLIDDFSKRVKELGGELSLQDLQSR